MADNLHQNINKLLRELHSADWLHALGLNAIRIIRKRTFAGKDVYGKSFQKYSPGYARKRERAGLLTHPVNLEFTRVSGMLDSLEHVVLQDLSDVQVKFTSDEAQQLARYHNIEGAGKSRVIRKFFGIELRTEKKQLEKIGAAEIKKLLQKLFKPL